MTSSTRRHDHDPDAETAERMLARFAFSVSAVGVFRIRPVGPVLSYEELDWFLERMRAEQVDQTLAEIVFDLATVEWIQTPWTAVIARFIDFARRSRARCRISALHGQPAAVVSFFSRDRVIRELLGVEEATDQVGTADRSCTAARSRAVS